MAERYSPYPGRDDRYRGEGERFEREQYGPAGRDFGDRTRDEVRSWFGDDDASRRRRLDEERDRWAGRSPGPVERNFRPEHEYRDRDREWHRDRDDWERRPAAAPRDPDSGTAWRTQRTMADAGRPRFGEWRSMEYGRDEYGARPYEPREASSERWRVPGPHAGRGPRSYQRSDERIREEVNDRLTAHGWIDATDIECRVQSGEVTLTGFVDSRAAKRAAEDVAEDIPGVREVHNELRVRTNAPDQEGVGRTSVLGLTESQTQTASTAGTADAGRSRTRS